MAEWWESAPVVQPAAPQSAPAQAGNWWDAAPVVGQAPQAPQAQPAPAAKDMSYRSSILPLSRDAQGSVHFDLSSGLTGAIANAFMLPGDVATGKVDPLSDEGIGRAAEFAGAFSPVNSAVRIGERAIPGALKAVRQEQPAIPTAEELLAAGSKGYNQVRDMGVDYSASSVKSLADKIRLDLEKEGLIAETAPKTFSILNKLTNPPDGSVATSAGIEAARRAFGKAGKDFNNPADQLASRRVVGGLDEFVQNPPPEGVLAGPAAEAARVATEARANYAAGKRAETLGTKEDTAALRAAAANSGQNYGNTLRQRVVDLITRPRESAGFNDAELASLRSIAEGSRGANATRYVGNLLGGGGGMGAAVSTGVAGTGAALATGNPFMAAFGLMAPVVGAGSRKISQSLTERAFSKADAMVRKRSPLYQDALKNSPFSVVSPDKRSALIKALILGELDQNQAP